MTHKKKERNEIFLHSILVLFALIQLFPLIWLVLCSFKDNLEITGTNVMGLPAKWRWSNYSYILTATTLGRNFMNSVFYTAVTVIASGFLAAMVSYAIVRMTWKLNKFVLAFFMTGLMIPVHAILLPLFIIMKNMKLLNTPWSLIIPYVVNALPTAIFILTGFFSTLPRELEEASVIDGCNIYLIFLKIMMPLIKPALVSTSVFTFLGAWNELMFAATFANRAELMTLTVAINSLRGVYFSEYGAIFAGLTLATLPSIIIYILLSEQVQKSLVAGAVKG